MRLSLHTTDVFEHANALPGWRQQYDQLSSGPLEGWLEVTDLAGIQVFRERLNQQVIQRIGFPCNAIHILLPLAWPQLDSSGLIVERCVTLLPGSGDYRVVTPAGMDVLCLSVPRPSLCGLVDEEMLERLRTTVTPERLRLPAAVLAEDIRLVQRLLKEDGSERGLELQLRLTMRVAEWLEQTIDARRDLPRPSTREYIVERCHQWLIEAPDASPSVIELCKRLKVSRRTLQYSFQSVAGMTPVQYLRAVRLNGARRALKQNPGANIAEVAERWGIGHSSYFSLEYQKLFAELPSALSRKFKSLPVS